MRDGYKLVFLQDIHAETNPIDKGWEPVVSPALWAALDFCKEFKPDETIIGGDFINFDLISKFTRNKPLLHEKKRLKYDFELGNQLLDTMDTFTLGKRVFLIGNHDARLALWIAENPQIEGLIGLDYNLRLQQRGWKVYPQGKVYKVGHAYFTHGWYWTMHHAKKTVLEMGNNIYYGHCHDVQSFTKANYEQKPIIGHSMGCLCDLNPEYKRDAPNRWVNGFGIFYFSKNGTFTAYNPIIVDGKFWWNSKLYGDKK